MPNDRRIPTVASPDVVSTVIKVNGTEIPQTFNVISTNVFWECNRIPTATLVLSDGDPAAEDFPASNDELFTPGNDIDIDLGYHSDVTNVFKGVIITQSINIRPNGGATLTLECKSKFVKMTIGKHSRYFYDSTDSDVFESLIGEYGLSANAATTAVAHQRLVQYDCTDWDFILSRAEKNGLLCIAEDDKLTIEPPDVGQEPVLNLIYGATILSFDAEIDSRYQPKAVKSKAWDAAKQEVVEVEAEAPETTDTGNLSPEALAEISSPEAFVLPSGIQATEDELKAWAEGFWLKQRLAKVRGNVSCQGVEAVKPGSVIELSGLGERFSGKVYVSGIRHRVADGNWITDAQFGLHPDWFTETYHVHTLPAAGLHPAIGGLQIGIVSKLEEDPDGEDRIQLRLPIIDPEEEGVWARLATLDAGENRGSVFRPEIGDEVVVGFLNDDPREAIVLGMLHSSAKPAPVAASDDNHEKGFVTRSEMKLLFNDDEKSITIETPNGNSILLSDQDGTIKLEDENGNKIVMDSEGITIESAQKIILKATADLEAEGVNINVKANAQLKAEGSAGAEVSSGGITTVKGSMVQIN